jgi:aryl carrier-like protein
VELEEIEYHVLNAIGADIALQVVADIVRPSGSTEPALVTFVKLSHETTVANTPKAQSYAEALAASTRGILSATMPSYMIPNGFMIVDKIPNTTSGKVDRGKLRRAASSMHKDDLLQANLIERRAPETPAEVKLHAIVSRVLARDGGTFGMDDNFIQLGGDSISAMRLASAARSGGISLTVADVLIKDRIADLLSGSLEEHDAGASDQQSQFALLSMTDPDAFVEEQVMPQIRPNHGNLVDVVPATDMQSTYLRDNLYEPRRSWFYSYIDFAQISDVERLVGRCEQLVQHCDIYRTAFVRYGDVFFQAIFDSWKPTIDVLTNVDCLDTALEEFVKEDVRSPAILGQPLVHFKLIHGRSGQAKLVLSMSHAVCDGISFGQTMQNMASLYNGTPRAINDFRSYVQHITSSKAASYPYWRETLRSSTMTIVPCTSTSSTLAAPPSVHLRSVLMPKAPSGITQATIFTLACASALSQPTGAQDVVFGRIVSGRAAVPASLQDVVEPCLNRVPVRVQFSRNRTKADRLLELQKQHANTLAHETTGLLDIVQDCTD